MKYMGSKSRHAKQFLPIILENRKKNQHYIEPFVGGANVIQHVDGLKIGADSNKYLIELLSAAAAGWLPRDDYTEKEYQFIKQNKDYDPILTGYFGFALSYGGKWFGGWCRDSAGKRDYVQEAYRNALKQFPLLKDTKFICTDYQNLEIPANSIIYCDPPYNNSTKYDATNTFNHEEFYDWCRKIHFAGHTIFISEYSMPSDFKLIWEKTVNSSLTKNTGSKQSTEKLFTL